MEAPALSTNDSLELNEAHALQVLTRFIHDEVTRTGFTRGVLGLSGGVDSALSTYLAVRALGKENVHVILMPYKTSAMASAGDALEVVRDLGITYELSEITAMADAFFDVHPEMDNIRKGNVMARLRMITLYDRSQRDRSLVIGTSNKTESLLGYTTLFGDNASAINPLGDLYKTQVWQLSEAIGVPRAIIDKAPSADLWEGQTDEAEMGLHYREVDKLLYRMVDLRETDEQLFKHGFDLDLIDKIRKMIVRSQFKRRPPIIAKIGSRTINVDFRYPRDWGS
jgi:NAD+ synthase